jgi:hypothetical protein
MDFHGFINQIPFSSIEGLTPIFFAVLVEVSGVFLVYHVCIYVCMFAKSVPSAQFHTASLFDKILEQVFLFPWPLGIDLDTPARLGAMLVPTLQQHSKVDTSQDPSCISQHSR